MQSLKRFVCSKCGKELANRHNLSRHKKNCRSHPYNAPAVSAISTVKSNGTTEPTFVAADAVKESFLKPRQTNPKILALIEEIVNDDDPKRNVPPPRVIHKGFSIIPPATTSSRSSKSSRQLAPRSQSTLTTREEPGMKKIKLSSSRRQPTRRVEYSDTDEDDESPLHDSDDDDTEINHPRTKGEIVGYSDEDDDHDDEIMDQEQHIDQDLEDRFNHLLIEFTREKKPESGQELAILLDKMQDRGLVTAVEYSKLNSLIDVPLAGEDDITVSDKEEVEEENEMARIIKETVDHVLRLDKNELSDLLMELRDEVGGEFLDVLIDVDLLTKVGSFISIVIKTTSCEDLIM